MKADVAPIAPHGLAGDSGPSWNGLNVLVLSPTPTDPLDAGNRRRIYHLTREVQCSGARIFFVHYPGEADWRTRAPVASLDAMQAQWEEYYTVPVTRPLHSAAIGFDHGLDEWWDPAIGDMLRWIFRTHDIDVMIVNYTWLSKAFEFCPTGVLKILDTHDRFSGRRELLARHGIEAEFFHTTPDEERIGLDRADVVWSIKPQEAAYFQELGARRVINMPYVEPIKDAAVPRRRHEFIRFGVLGAANSVNRINIENFIREFKEYVARTLLPCEIFIGGTICDQLPPPLVPWIHMLGRLPDVVDFYEQVDVVLAPIAFSTGLKIKVGEALCHGKAVVALAHAFEGFPPQHAYHTLSSLAEMMKACRRIVNEPALVDELERLSIVAVRATQTELARGLFDTIAELGRFKPAVCFIVAAADIFDGSLVLDHLLEAASYIGYLAPICVFVDGRPEHVAESKAFDLLLALGSVILAPALLQSPFAEMQRAKGTIRSLTMAELLGTSRLAFWFASRVDPWPKPSSLIATRAYVNLDVLRLVGPLNDAHDFLAYARQTFLEVVAVSRQNAHPVNAGHGVIGDHRVPMFWSGAQSRILAYLAKSPRASVVILADAADEPLLGLTVALVLRLSSHPIDIILPHGEDSQLITGCDPSPRLRILEAPRSFAAERPQPLMVLDISTDLSLEGLREVFGRSSVPFVTLFANRTRPAHGSWSEADGAGGLFESVALLQRILNDPDELWPDRRRKPPGSSSDPVSSYENDAGWALVWEELKDLQSIVRTTCETIVVDSELTDRNLAA